MPWKVVQRGEQHCVVKEGTGEVVKCHPTRDKAIAHQRALYANYDKENATISSELKRGKSLSLEVMEIKGGGGSGNFGHRGRPGLVGGSSDSGGSPHRDVARGLDRAIESVLRKPKTESATSSILNNFRNSTQQEHDAALFIGDFDSEHGSLTSTWLNRDQLISLHKLSSDGKNTIKVVSDASKSRFYQKYDDWKVFAESRPLPAKTEHDELALDYEAILYKPK